MRIKLFETWNKRYPKSISMDDWSEKKDEWKNGNSEPFNESENRFFNKLVFDNKKGLYHSKISKSDIMLGLYPTGKNGESIQAMYREIRYIEIYKMKDSWYLLYDDDNGEYYLCDEFEEVEGYLGTKTTLKYA